MSRPNQEAMLATVIGWLEENLPPHGDPITADTRLIAENLLDSMDLLRLVSFLEDTYALAFDPDQLIPENFDTPATVANAAHSLLGL